MGLGDQTWRVGAPNLASRGTKPGESGSEWVAAVDTSPAAYDQADVERVPRRAEPTRRRPPFERDRARIVHSAALRRLAAKTQVVGPSSDDFIRNRLTHTLEVAQVGRDLAVRPRLRPRPGRGGLPRARPRPPAVRPQRRARAQRGWPQTIGGFEGNAQTFRLLTRLEAKTFDAERPQRSAST